MSILWPDLASLPQAVDGQEMEKMWTNQVYARVLCLGGQTPAGGQLSGSFVTTGLVQWNGEWVIARDEDRPGHRTARVIAGRHSSAITKPRKEEILCPIG
jgi:hypothetical protein